MRPKRTRRYRRQVRLPPGHRPFAASFEDFVMLPATMLVGLTFALVASVGCSKKEQHTIVADTLDAALRDSDARDSDAASDPPARIATHDPLTFVYSKPRHDHAAIAGFLRGGTVLERSKNPVDGEGCKGGWYAVQPFGFLCDHYDGVTLDPNDPIVVLASQYPPHLDAALPYGYGTSLGSPLYLRVPTKEQARSIEGANYEAEAAARDKSRESLPLAERWPKFAVEPGPLPAFLKDHGIVPGAKLAKKGSNGLTAGDVPEKTGLSFLAAFESDGRFFYLTTDFFIVPADRVKPAKTSSFHGAQLVPLDAIGEHLPMLWAHLSSAPLFRFSEGRAKRVRESLPLRGHTSILPKSLNVGGVQYYELVAPPEDASYPDARYLIRTDAGTRVDPCSELPKAIGEQEAWIDVNLKTQALVMYQGLVPTYVTLVSTGLDRAQDWRTARSTPQGLYRIATKQVSSRMQSNPKKSRDPDTRYRVDEVPYAQHFFRGYALHAAYWHEAFGMPVSHGCINLSPLDAKALFERTSPSVPDTWHGVIADTAGSEKGTWVRVRPE